MAEQARAETYSSYRNRLLAASIPATAAAVFGVTLLFEITLGMIAPERLRHEWLPNAIQILVPVALWVLARGPLRDHPQAVLLGADLAYTATLLSRQAFPAAATLRDVLLQLEREFARSQAFGELELKGNRDAATTALVVLAALILVSLFLLFSDVNRRILSPCADAAAALEDLVAGRTPARLAETSDDEIGALASNFNAASRIYEERGRGIIMQRGGVAWLGDGARGVIGTAGSPDDLKPIIKDKDWNQIHVIARGNTLIHILNGRVTAILVDDDVKNRSAKGLIGFQIHTGPPMKVEFRNVLLKQVQ